MNKKLYRKDSDKIIKPEGRGEGTTLELIPPNTKVRVALDYPRNINEKRLIGTFRATDVRWEIQPSHVIDVVLLPNEPLMYRVSGHEGVLYTKQQLQIVPEHENNPPASLRSHYVVERITKKKKAGTKIYYMVKWDSYPTSANTWESRTQLMKDAPDMVKEFEDSQ